MKKILFAAVIAFAAVSLRADADGYFMLSVFSPGQLPAPSSTIYGGRLSLIYGDCHELYGVDFGITGSVREHMDGAQFNLFWNGIGTDMAGFQLGVANTVEGYFAGWQLGLVNVSDELYGCQLGLVDVASAVYGCQLGLVNVTTHLYGCQLGLLNFSTDRAWTFWPFINIGW